MGQIAFVESHDAEGHRFGVADLFRAQFGASEAARGGKAHGRSPRDATGHAVGRRAYRHAS